MTLLVLAVVGITAGGVALAGSGRRRRRRLATRAARDLPGAVGDLARSVGAGATLTVALRELAGGPVGLLGTEVAGAVALLDRGLGVDRVMELWGRASRIDGVELLVAACRFSRGRGVALVAALDGVAAALVDRIELDDEVRALTSQARTSATVLVALPLIGVTVLAAVDPSFAGVVLGSGAGRACLVVGVVLDGLGAVVSNRLVTRAVAAPGVQGSGRRKPSMGPLMPWLLAAAAAVAVADLVVPRPRPRRFPEDEPVSAVRAEPTRASATAVVDRAFRAILVARLPTARPRAERSPERPLARPAAGGRSVEELWDMAHCCDLLAVAAAAGSTVAGSVEAVGDVGDGPVASALGRAGADLQRGKVLADVIASLRHELGPAGQPLVTTLSTAASSGTPPAAALVRLADAERRRSRRRIEARVRRLPVLLLIPLVALVLPAFVMLTVVPVVLSAARGTGALLGAATASAGPFPLPPSAPFVPRGGPP